MIYRIMPERYKVKIKDWLYFSGSRKTPSGFVNYAFSFAFTLGFLLTFLINIYNPLSTLLFFTLWFSVFLAFFALLHGTLIMIIDKRTKNAEKILPDALQLMAANSRAGYIPSRALLMSARPEFGPLAESIKNVGKEMMTGRPLDESLQQLHKNIKSPMLEKTTKLITEGIKSGGEFAILLEENANDIRRIQILKREMRASVLLYIIFITFAGTICAPVLYSLSSFLIGTIGSFGAMAQVPGGALEQVSFLTFSGLEVSQEFLFFFSIIAILITTSFSGLIIALISHGKERAGIKYVPIMVILGLVIFLLLGSVISTVFGTMAP